jgi:hypothetical protein
MRTLPSETGVFAALLSAFALAGACGSSKTGVNRGTGGVTGSGGAVPGGGGIVGSGGTTPSSTFTSTSGGGAGAGGQASGGAGGGIGSGGADASASGGIGGVASGGMGGIAAGGNGASTAGGTGAGGMGSGGTGPRASGGNASGGIGAGGTGAGGTGGIATGGAGGSGTGGVVALDGGCTGTLCAQDAAASDASLPSCSGLASTECNLRNDCHSVYVDPRDCTCTEESCCMRFDHCADGDMADCIGPALCNTLAPICEGQYYTVGFKNGCYEGCVRKNECAVPACPPTPPADGTSCGPVDHPCLYEDCAGKGRTLATCAAGTWSVATTACGSVTCEGVGVSPLAITCAAGQVCVRTSTSNVVYTVQPTCVDNTCGANPISPECLTGLSGDCSVEASTAGGSIYCVLPPPCQGAGGCDYMYP